METTEDLLEGYRANRRARMVTYRLPKLKLLADAVPHPPDSGKQQLALIANKWDRMNETHAYSGEISHDNERAVMTMVLMRCFVTEIQRQLQMDNNEDALPALNQLVDEMRRGMTV